MKARLCEKTTARSEEVPAEDFDMYPQDYRRRLNSEASVHPMPSIAMQPSPQRSRSSSVSLPVDPNGLRNIGASLRRLSDEFYQGRVTGEENQQEDAETPSSLDESPSPNPAYKIFKRSE